jgi:hypothetical protein
VISAPHQNQAWNFVEIANFRSRERMFVDARTAPGWAIHGSAVATQTTCTRMPGIKKILVPIDFSETSQRVLDLGRTLADVSGASLHLLHVIGNPLQRPRARSGRLPTKSSSTPPSMRLISSSWALTGMVRWSPWLVEASLTPSSGWHRARF